MAVRKQVEQDLAKVLFVNDGNIQQNEIAARVGVTEKTLTKWIKAGNWEELKVSMLVTKDNQLKALYGQLAAITKDITTRPIVRDIPAFILKPIKVKDADGAERLEYPDYKEEDYPIKIGNFPNSNDTDKIAKITAAIKRLETETNIGETIEVLKNLIGFIRIQDVNLSNQVLKFADVFIKEKMK